MTDKAMVAPVRDRIERMIRDLKDGAILGYDGPQEYWSTRMGSEASAEVARLLSAALAQAEQPVACGVFRNGEMIAWVPGPDEDAEYKLPEDTDERRPLYASPSRIEAGENTAETAAPVPQKASLHPAGIAAAIDAVYATADGDARQVAEAVVAAYALATTEGSDNGN